MKIVTIILLMMGVFCAKAQDSTAVSDTMPKKIVMPDFTPLDTIIKINGDTLVVNIKYKDFDQVIFIYPYTQQLQKMMIPSVNELHYNDGVTVLATEKPDSVHVEKIDTTTKIANKENIIQNNETQSQLTSWLDIIVVKTEAELPAGAVRVSELIADFKGEFNSNNAFLEKSVLIILKKKALRLNAQYLLIINQDVIRRYDEEPRIQMTAAAYMVP